MKKLLSLLVLMALSCTPAPADRGELLTTTELNSRLRWQLVSTKLRLKEANEYIGLLEKGLLEGARTNIADQRLKLLLEERQRVISGQQ